MGSRWYCSIKNLFRVRVKLSKSSNNKEGSIANASGFYSFQNMEIRRKRNLPQGVTKLLLLWNFEILSTLFTVAGQFHLDNCDCYFILSALVMLYGSCTVKNTVNTVLCCTYYCKDQRTHHSSTRAKSSNLFFCFLEN